MNRKRLADEKSLTRVRKYRAINKFKQEYLNQNDEDQRDSESDSTVNNDVTDDHLSEGSIRVVEMDQLETDDHLSEGEIEMVDSDNSGEAEGNTSQSELSTTTESNEDSDSNSDSDSNDISSSEEEEEDEDQQTIDQLRQWAVKNKIQLAHLDELLGILNIKLPNLPKCAKTFLRTNEANYNIVEMLDINGDHGEFVYFGVSKGLHNCVNDELHPNKLIELQINVDEVRIANSSNKKFCPILCKVHCSSDVYEPFPAAIYFGESKPDVNLFLEEFITEINNLQRDGIEISGQHYSVIVKCFICDTPARAFLKCTVGHKHFNSCERCTETGYTVLKNTSVFPKTDNEKRTDESFRNRSQPGHHKGVSPLLQILPHLNIINIFILDSMHLCFEGIMKKLLCYWVIKGSNKLKVDNRQELSRRIKMIKGQIPSEFQRKPRSINHVAKWKATEFRFFLLYCGPIVLKYLLISKLYKHFLLLHTAVRILCSDKYCTKYTENAKDNLEIFFNYLKEYYRPSSQTLNSHHLTHLADDVSNMDCSLSRISAFPFENFLGKLKKQLRTPHRPLAQVCRRLYEQSFVNIKKPKIPQVLEILEFTDDDIVKIQYKQYILSVVSPNNVVLLKNKTVLQISRIEMNDESANIIGKVWEKKNPIFTYSVNSNCLNMWELNQQPLDDIVSFPLSSVDCKMVCLSLNFQSNTPERVFVVPLLHK